MTNEKPPILLPDGTPGSNDEFSEQRRSLLKSFALYALVAPPVIASILNVGAQNALAQDGSTSEL